MPNDYAFQILALLYKQPTNTKLLYSALVPRGYDKNSIRVNLVRLLKRGLIEKIEGTHFYRLTDKGMKLFESRFLHLKTLETLLDLDFSALFYKF
jgi:DNA-binding PadR family transcriptional regulator